MPRGPKKGKRGKHAAAEDWETDSAASTGTTVASRMDRSAEREAIFEEPDIWLQFEEAMDSKRSATRERALKDMVDCLRSGVLHSEVVRRMATLSNYLERAFHVKRSTASEMRLSATALALMMLQLAAEEAPRGLDYLEEMFDGRLLAALQQKAADASGEAKAAVLTCIAILAFVSEHHLAESMATLRSHWYAKAEKARVAALEGWALLMTIDTAHMQPEDIELVLSQLAGILGEATTAEERNVSVRVASGRAFALLYGKFDLGGLQEAEDVDMEARSEASMGGGSSCASQADGGPGSGLGAMKKRIQELVRDRKDHGWRISGAELTHQKSSLREVDLVIEQGGVLLPKPETVKLKHGGSFVVESWEQKLQKEALVALLQGGFQVHCEANRMIVQLFDIDVRTRCTDAEERRAAKTIPMSAESKWRDQERKCKRSATRTYKDSFLLCEL